MILRTVTAGAVVLTATAALHLDERPFVGRRRGRPVLPLAITPAPRPPPRSRQQTAACLLVPDIGPYALNEFSGAFAVRRVREEYVCLSDTVDPRGPKGK
jgi:hypothetical protein